MKFFTITVYLSLVINTLIAGNFVLPTNTRLESQEDSLKSTNHKVTALYIAEGTAYLGAMTGLYMYKYINQLQPHYRIKYIQNDWRVGMDGTHHILATYYIARLGYDVQHWAGLNEKRAVWISGLTGLACLTSQEIMDGFATDWSSSLNDEVTNVLGSALFISQQLAWHEQRIVPKWSYHSTSFPSYRPELLGDNFAERMIKDYNGQTFWLSANLNSFAAKDSRIPKWLNLSVGIGATGLTGPEIIVDPGTRGDIIPDFTRQHLFYIAPDIDLTRIRTRSATLKWIFEAIGFLKIPMPALEISGQGVKFHPLFF
jgi:hypothetical protein